MTASRESQHSRHAVLKRAESASLKRYALDALASGQRFE
jgi:hypothetical protein